jgi:hypothetical protein
MDISTHRNDERVESVYFTRGSLVVDLVDGRTISVPLAWYPKLLKATLKQRSQWESCGGGHGIHWPEIDEDLSVEGLLRGAPAPKTAVRRNLSHVSRRRSSKRVKHPRTKPASARRVRREDWNRTSWTGDYFPLSRSIVLRHRGLKPLVSRIVSSTLAHSVEQQSVRKFPLMMLLGTPANW